MKVINVKIGALCIGLVSLVMSAAAQTAQTTPVTTISGGTLNSIPVFTSSSNLESSIISQTNGKVGIGTTTPQYALQIVGGEAASMGTNAGFRVESWNGDDVNGAPWYGIGQSNLSFYDGFPYPNSSVQVAGYWGLNFQTAGGQMVMRGDTGNVGIGTSTPQAELTVGNRPLGTNAGNTVNLVSLENGNGNQSYFNIFQLRNSNGSDWTTTTTRVQQVIDATPMGYIDFNPPNGNFGLAFGSNPCCGTNNPVEYMRIAFGGNVGIGTTSPSYKLDVAGQIHTSGAVVFADGTTQSTAWTGSLCGGDYAESIDVSDDRKKYEPGDVLVIDPENPGKFLKSAESYSTSVLGIYSTKPGVLGRRQTTEKSSDEIPMAMIGIVPTKVSAENGAIKPGDLLVSSSTPGYAMKGTDRSRMLGAVLGKALGSLESGTGVIEVGITLQ